MTESPEMPDVEQATENQIMSVEEMIIEYFPENHEEAKDIFTCESNLIPTAQNLNDPNGGSFGVAQINLIHGHPIEELLDAETNLKIARELYEEKGSWISWRNCAERLNLL